MNLNVLGDFQICISVPLIWKYFTLLLISDWFGVGNAKVEAINLTIQSFNWENALDGKDIHAQIVSFNESLLSIFSNFTSNRTKTFTDGDPPWMTKDIKKLIFLKNKF